MTHAPLFTDCQNKVISGKIVATEKFVENRIQKLDGGGYLLYNSRITPIGGLKR